MLRKKNQVLVLFIAVFGYFSFSFILSCVSRLVLLDVSVFMP